MMSERSGSRPQWDLSMDALDLGVFLGLVLSGGAYMFALLVGAPLPVIVLFAAVIVIIMFASGGVGTVGYTLTAIGILELSNAVSILTGIVGIPVFVMVFLCLPLFRRGWRVYKHKRYNSTRLSPNGERPEHVQAPPAKPEAAPEAVRPVERAITDRNKHKARNLLLLVLICVVPFLILVYYLATPSVLVPYSVTEMYTTASSVTYEYPMPALLVGYSLTTSSISTCYPYYYCYYVYSTMSIGVYSSWAITTTVTSMSTLTSVSSLVTTLAPSAVPERGGTAAIILVIVFVVGVLFLSWVGFLRPAPKVEPAIIQQETEPQKVATKSGMKFCRECGAKIPRDSVFCEECGSKLG